MPDPTDPSARSHARRTSREIIQDAVRWASTQGLRVVASASPGIICTSAVTCEWVPDPEATGVSPLGAAVLMRQGELGAILSANVDRACFLAVGESARWVDGFAAGVAGVMPDAHWSTDPVGPVYSNGWAAGRDIWTAAKMRTLVQCRHHPWVKYEPDKACPRCASEEDEPTRPDTRSEAEIETSDPNLTPVMNPHPETPHGV